MIQTIHQILQTQEFQFALNENLPNYLNPEMIDANLSRRINKVQFNGKDIPFEDRFSTLIGERNESFDSQFSFENIRVDLIETILQPNESLPVIAGRHGIVSMNEWGHDFYRGGNQKNRNWNKFICDLNKLTVKALPNIPEIRNNFTNAPRLSFSEIISLPRVNVPNYNLPNLTNPQEIEAAVNFISEPFNQVANLLGDEVDCISDTLEIADGATQLKIISLGNLFYEHLPQIINFAKSHEQLLLSDGLKALKSLNEFCVKNNIQ